MTPNNAATEWTHLKGLRASLERRWEAYSAYTLPRLYPPTGHNEYTDSIEHGPQALGAQGTNHVANKLMMALFNPARPFLRLDLTTQGWADTQVSREVVTEALSAGEVAAIKQLDRTPDARPKLYQGMLNLIDLGNVLVILPLRKGDPLRVLGLRNYVVQRTGNGKVRSLVTEEKLKFGELDDKVQQLPELARFSKEPNQEVCLYHWVRRARNGSYRMSQWVNDVRLPAAYDGKWPEKDCPFLALTWNLRDEDDYGTGLVEDFAGDFAGLTALSQSQIDGALLASEFRWLVNPGGFTSPDEFMTSRNGAALPGVTGDLNLVVANNGASLAIVKDMAAEYVRRIGFGFLMNSAVTRQAERVTAEEFRAQVMELESSFGGVYSRLAVSLQEPLARWLLSEAGGVDVKDTKLDITIITGLDALSRSGELANLRGALSDFAGISTLPPLVLNELNLQAIGADIFAGWGLSFKKYAKTVEQKKAEARSQQAAIAEAENAKAQAQAGGRIAEAQATGATS